MQHWKVLLFVGAIISTWNPFLESHFFPTQIQVDITEREPMLLILPFPNPYSAHTHYTVSLFSPVSRDAKCSPELLPL